MYVYVMMNPPDKTDNDRMERVTRSVLHSISTKKSVDVVVKIRGGEVVEFTNTEIVRFK
jgi:hypothetical protein